MNISKQFFSFKLASALAGGERVIKRRPVAQAILPKSDVYGD
jgi:hypothetical protein